MDRSQRIRELAKVIGDKSFHPVPGDFIFFGVTYREWLIGQALSAHGDWIRACTAAEYTLIEMAEARIYEEDRAKEGK